MMAEILETTMLICFGLSWPLNVYRSYMAQTAKGMSLPFILLIITHHISYVLLVYLVNLAIVSVNLLVYFRNRRLDKQEGVQHGNEVRA